MGYYDSDCFWTNEELGRKIIEQDTQSQGLLNWLKQLLVYVVDLEDHVIKEVNNQAGDRSIEDDDDQNSYRTKL